MKNEGVRNGVCLIAAKAVNDLGSWICRVAMLTLALEVYGGADKAEAEKERPGEALRYIRSVPTLWVLFLTFAAIGLAAGVLNSLLIVYVYNDMGQTAAGYGALVSVKGAAMLGASMAQVFLAQRITSQRLFVSSLIGMGVALVAFPLNENFALALGIQAVNGVCNAANSVSRTTLVQTTAEPGKLGRVLAANGMIFNVLSVVSLSVFGVLADVVSVRAVLLAGGGIVLAAGILAAILFRRSGSEPAGA